MEISLMRNKFSWIIIITFLFSWFSMEYYSGSNVMEGLIISLPLVCIVIYMSEKGSSLKYQTTILSVLNREFIIISTSFFFGTLLSLIINYDNTDLRGWWPLYLYVFFIISLGFSLFYILISWIFSFHNEKYNYFFSSILVLALVSPRFLPLYVTIDSIGKIYTLTVLLFTLILTHMLILGSLKLLNRISKPTPCIATIPIH